MQDVIQKAKELSKTETGKAFMQTQCVGIKIGIQSLLRCCEEAHKRGIFSIDAVRIMADNEINTINGVLEEATK